MRKRNETRTDEGQREWYLTKRATTSSRDTETQQVAKEAYVFRIMDFKGRFSKRNYTLE